MITLQNCIALCGLTEEEVLAVAEHERLPRITSTALAANLLSQEHGSATVRDMIIDDSASPAAIRSEAGADLAAGRILRRRRPTIPGASGSNVMTDFPDDMIVVVALFIVVFALNIVPAFAATHVGHVVVCRS
jgi:hypothetical protein